MAGPLDTGQLILTYLIFLPILFSWLISELHLAIAVLFSFRRLWLRVRLRVYCHPFKHRKKKSIARPPQIYSPEHHLPRTYLLMAAAVSLFKVGCRVESFISHRLRFSRPPPRIPATGSLLHRVACQASVPSHSSTPAAVRFDTDSFQIGIDNHCSVSMVKSKDYFKDLVLDDHKRRVDGIEGGLDILGRGTFRFDIEDDDGEVHTIHIPNSVYVPGLRYCLLSPQHWAQMANDHHPAPRGTRMENDDRHCVLIWGQGRYRRSVPHSSSTNTPTFRTAPATTTYRTFVALHEAMEAQYHRREHVLQIPGLRPNVDEEFVAEENLLLDDVDKSAFADTTHDDVTSPTSNLEKEAETEEEEINVTRMGPLTFDLTPPLESSDRVDVVAADDQAELMRWHHRLGHLSFAKLKVLAENNEIPKKLAKVKPPTCAGCLYGAMTKVPWRGKDNAGEVFIAMRPGQCLSVDQMISTQVGFIAQLKGSLTKKRYKAATIFVDHFSRLQYVHLMTKLSSEETVAAKHAFEQFADQNGIRIEHYHCDNGRFADNDFKLACEQARQRLTFPKWDCREGHPRPLRERSKTTAPRPTAMASCRPSCPLAVCFAKRHLFA